VLDFGVLRLCIVCLLTLDLRSDMEAQTSYVKQAPRGVDDEVISVTFWARPFDYDQVTVCELMSGSRALSAGSKS